MRKWIFVAGLLIALLAILRAPLLTPSRAGRPMSQPSVPPAYFIEVTPPILPGGAQSSPHRDLAGTLKYGAALTAAYGKAALQGKQPGITWSSDGGGTLALELHEYRMFVGQPVFMGENVRGLKVGAFSFSALTATGVAGDFEQMMKTNGVVFIRDSTNTIWIMHATNELAFRQQFGVAR